ncbi:MAG TPA: periplasmic heavy metal sensor [Vicinamibacteria bacterium]|nr:periplasmic heavy metal sensor [Vicinamibacteria bacterium]
MTRNPIIYAALGAAGVLALVAARPISAAMQDGGGFHRAFAGHLGGWGHHGAANPEAVKDHVHVATKWALRDAGASDDQQERVNTIVDGAIDDLFRLQARHQTTHDAFVSELGAASVDRAALEETRKKAMGLADEASKRIVQALADVADVLTPEQRQALIEHAHRMHGN